jgi:thymidylate synthase (FAD)
MPLEVFMIGRTEFLDDQAALATGGVWVSDDDASDGALLVEFAGRGCYDSFEKPNPKTRSNVDYLGHIEEVGHWSVMEHATVTFYIKGVSRSLTHELVRHRHQSPSQLSQRFVVLKPDVMVRSIEDFVVPPLYEHPTDTDAAMILMDLWEAAIEAYEKLLPIGERRAKELGLTGTLAKKRAREAARAVLPNMTPTAITLTGNHRAWRDMLLKRLQPEADLEISRLAQVLFRMLSEVEPALYQDLQVVLTDEGPSLRAIPPSSESMGR